MPESLRDRVARAIALVQCGGDEVMIEKPLTGNPNYKYWHFCRIQGDAVLKALGISDAMYQHYKGNTYDYYLRAIKEDTHTEVVVYRSQVDRRFWVRDVAEFFFDTVEVNGEIFMRFAKVEP